MHWAALTGNVEACSVLAHSGLKVELTVKDKAGKTPVQLASDKGHRHIALFLVCKFIGNFSQFNFILCFCGHCLCALRPSLLYLHCLVFL